MNLVARSLTLSLLLAMPAASFADGMADATAASASASASATPAPECFAAREVREARQSDARTLVVRLNDESRWRLALGEGCPNALWSEQPRLLSPRGQVCTGGGAWLDRGDRRCAVLDVARIDAREYADHALRARNRQPTADDLDTIVVRGKRVRGFVGSTAYCVDARHVRGWRDDGSDLVLETSPTRAGGHRYYRVEFNGVCSEMGTMTQLVLKSQVGGTAICGHPGDRAVFSRDEDELAFGAGIARRIVERGLAAQAGCSIARVYPILPGDPGG